MRNLITTATLLGLLGSPVAIAQTIGNARSSAGLASPTAPSAESGQRGPSPALKLQKVFN